MLDELRKKPLAVRRLYAFWGAAGITSFIGVFWVVSIIIKISALESIPVERTDQTASAFSQFMSKTRERFSPNSESEESNVKASDEVDQNQQIPEFPFFNTPPSSPSPSAPAILIATTSPRSIRISTSTPSAE